MTTDSHADPCQIGSAMCTGDYWKTVTVDRSDLLDRLLAKLRAHQIPFCVIGGRPSTLMRSRWSAHVDLVIAAEHIATAVRMFGREFHVEQLEHSVSVSAERAPQPILDRLL